MAFNKNGNGVNEEQIASFLSDALSRVEADSDPETLNLLKKIYKKNIPFSRRMYVAAWLVKQATNGGYYAGSRFNRNDRSERNDRNDRFSRDRNERNEQRPSRFEDRRAERSERTERPSAEHADDRAERAPRVQIDPSLATTIFIGIGRNRRVYPRDLVGLLVSVAGLERERIGDIRVLANYSFIQLFTADCEKAIAALNGYDYRGRKLSVSYSRQKDEDGSAEQSEDSASTESAVETAPAAAEAKPVADTSAEDRIPADVRNDTHAVHAESTEEAQLAAEQSAFAAQQKTIAPEKTFTETTDDGQVKSHFSTGDSNYLV